MATSRIPTAFSHAIIALGMGCLIAGCGKTMTSYIVRGEFRYINQTKEDLRFLVRGEMMNGTTLQEYHLPPNDTLVLNIQGETDLQEADPLGFTPAISGDTTTLMVNDTLCYKEYNRRGPRLQNIRAYKSEKRTNRSYVFYYQVDSSLLSNAALCK